MISHEPVRQKPATPMAEIQPLADAANQADEAELGELPASAISAAHPDQGVPGTGLIEHVFPFNDFCQQQERNRRHGDSGCVEFVK